MTLKVGDTVWRLDFNMSGPLTPVPVLVKSETSRSWLLADARDTKISKSHTEDLITFPGKMRQTHYALTRDAAERELLHSARWVMQNKLDKADVSILKAVATALSLDDLLKF